MLSCNYKSIDLNSSILGHCVSAFIFITLFLISQILSESGLDNQLNGECKLRIIDNLNICTRCDYNCVSPQSDEIILSNCIEFKGNSTQLTTCNDIISRRNSVCKISLEISHIAQHEDLILENKCFGSKKIDYTFTFKSIKLDNDLKDDFRIFNNLETLVYDVVTLKDSDLNLTRTKNLLDSLDRMNELTLTNIVSNTPLQFDFEMKSLKKLTVLGGKYLGIPKGAFFLGRKVISSVELSGVDLANNKINTGSFIIDACESCGGTLKTVNITLDSMDITTEMLEKDPIDLNGCLTSGCSNMTLKIYLKLTKNLLARKIYESNFRKLFETNYNLYKVDFTLNYDEIDCCVAENRWLFELNENTSKALTNIDVGCIDLPMKFNEFANETDLIAKCDKRNVYPIILIAILSCLLLIVLFAAFGFICLFYVIPRQGQAIVLDSKGRKLDKLSSETAANSSDLSSLNSDCLEDDMVVKKLVPTVEGKRTISKDSSPTKDVVKGDKGEKLDRKTLNLSKQTHRFRSHKTVTEKAKNYNLPKFSLKLSVKKSSKLNRIKKRKKRSGFDSQDVLNTGKKGKQKKHGSINTLGTNAVQQHLDIGSSSHSHTKPRDLTKTVRNSPLDEPIKTKTVAKERTKSVQKVTSKSITPASDATKSIPQQKTASGSATAAPAAIKKSEDDVAEGMSLVLRTIDE